MRLWLAAVGLVSILGQVVLLRELLVTFFGSELIYLLAFGLLLPGAALGVWAGRFFRAFSGRRVRLLFLLFAAALPMLLASARALRALLGGVPGAFLPFPSQILGMAVVLLPFGILTGLLFQRAAGAFVSGSRTLAEAYAIESAGGLAGGVLATVLIAAGVQNLAAGLLCAAAAVLASLFPLRADRPRWLFPAALPLLALLSGALWFSPFLDRRLTAMDHPRLAATRDTPYGRVTVDKDEGQVAVFENGALAFESQGTSAEEFVHAAALQVENPRSVLLLGGAVDGLAGELLKHRPERITDVELDRRMLDLVLPLLHQGSLADRKTAGVHVEIADPRRFLSGHGEYDLILSAMPEPESGQANRYFTREFFEACRSRLRKGGVFAFRLRSLENLWTPALLRRNASIHGALRDVFQDVLVLPGTTNLFLASSSPLCRDPEVLARRLTERGITARLVSPPYLRYILTNDRMDQVQGLLAGARAPQNTDARPICYQFTLVLWLSKFFPVLGLLDLWPAVGGRGIAWLALVPVVLFLALLPCRRSDAWRRSLLAAFAGFTGMVLESALILGYQVQRGILFQDLGLLLTAFMAGLALGALLQDRLARRRQGEPGQGTGAALACGFAGLALLCGWLFRVGAPMTLALTTLLLATCGFFVGALFGYASLLRVRSQASAVAPLYAADLLGGCIGSLAGSLFLLPVLGLPSTGLVLALVAGASLVLI